MGGRAADRRARPDIVSACELQERWARRHHLLAWGVTDRATSTATATLAEHLRQAAQSEPPDRSAHGDNLGRLPFHDC
ncbi:hypothetical protein [Streptomyces sp. NPDC000133]|uniref:hypothetical protein n=1 Tax=Streptomyces sp. NPDC000133 TaxID=3364535 RepID=UPI00367725F9